MSREKPTISNFTDFDPAPREMGLMPDRIVVPAADFVRNIGHWQNQALEQPIAITYHGRERLILVSAKRFDEVREEGPNAEHPSTDATAPELQWLLDAISRSSAPTASPRPCSAFRQKK
jgi:hypothetical protein